MSDNSVNDAIRAQNEQASRAIAQVQQAQIESARLTGQALDAIAQVVCDAVQSTETKRAYRRALTSDNADAPGFLVWYAEQGEPVLNKATVQRYLAYLRDDLGKSAAMINQRRSAINKLVREAVDNNAMPEQAATGILRIEGERQEGELLGNWLIKEQAQELLDAPDTSTLRGLRDRALLAVAIGTGLRRSEIAALTFAHVQMRESRWAIMDIIGKRNKVRTVPMASWIKTAIDEYAQAAGLSDGRIFRRISKLGHKLVQSSQGVSAQTVYDVIRFYSYELWGDDSAGALAAHDTRRTYAHLALKGGAPIEQISLTLGHESIQTTQRYLGVQLDLTNSPSDKLGLRIESKR